MEKRPLELKHVEIRGGSWKNFSGLPTQYNKAGDRNFTIFVTEEQAEYLESYGVNVRRRPGREEGDDDLRYIKVNVNLNSKYPPRFYIFTENADGSVSESELGFDEVDKLDGYDIKDANIQVNLRESDSKIYGHTVTLYLHIGAFLISDGFKSLFDFKR